jgi:GNAT superfamily N-acetyltransferase
VNVSEDVRRFAESPAAWGEISPESGLERILTDRYCILFGSVASFTLVSRLRLDPDEIPEAIAEVRSHVAERGHREASWWVGSSATPRDLVDRLRSHGLVPDERPGSEPHATTLVLDREPPAGPPEIETRRVETLEEFRQAGTVSGLAFGESDEAAAAWDAIAEERFAAERAGHGPRAYLAFLDGRTVGAARALVAADCPAVLMISGGVLPEARGRGVYRALVRARWDDAVAAGIPALCTQAGVMSRPILDRLGFQAVAEQEVLLDPSTC